MNFFIKTKKLCPGSLVKKRRNEYDRAIVDYFYLLELLMLKKNWHFFHRLLSGIYAKTMLRHKIFWDAPLPNEAFILAVNHPTTTDPLLLPVITRHPMAILVTEMAFDLPLFGKILRAAGHIPVFLDRSNAEQLDGAVEMLNTGRSIGIFPEGGLSPKVGSFGRAHTGAARLALMSGAPVVPVGIHMLQEGVASSVTKSENFESVSQWAVRGPYYLSIGEPMGFNGDVEDRPLVRNVTKQIWDGVKEQAYRSEERMKAEQPLWLPLSRFLLWRSLF